MRLKSLDAKVGTKKKKRTCKILGFLIFGFITLLALDNRLKVVHYYIETPKIDGQIKIALVTDLHSCLYGENQSELIEAIDIEKPDLILLGGDIYDEELPYHNSDIFLENVSKRYPCYYVTGNHEYWGGDIKNILEKIEGYGINILEGTCLTEKVNGSAINLCGINDLDAIVYAKGVENMEEQLANLQEVSNNGYYTILLSHRPNFFETFVNYDFDLVLAGHEHGGQWRIPGLINGLYTPGEGFFPKYAGGKYEYEETDLIVSRGLGRESTRIPRIFNRPELVIVTLSQETKENR